MRDSIPQWPASHTPRENGNSPLQACFAARLPLYPAFQVVVGPLSEPRQQAETSPATAITLPLEGAGQEGRLGDDDLDRVGVSCRRRLATALPLKDRATFPAAKSACRVATAAGGARTAGPASVSREPRSAGAARTAGPAGVSRGRRSDAEGRPAGRGEVVSEGPGGVAAADGGMAGIEGLPRQPGPDPPAARRHRAPAGSPGGGGRLLWPGPGTAEGVGATSPERNRLRRGPPGAEQLRAVPGPGGTAPGRRARPQASESPRCERSGSGPQIRAGRGQAPERGRRGRRAVPGSHYGVGVATAAKQVAGIPEVGDCSSGPRLPDAGRLPAAEGPAKRGGVGLCSSRSATGNRRRPRTRTGR